MEVEGISLEHLNTFSTCFIATLSLPHGFVNSRNLIGQSEGTKSLCAHLCRALS